MFGTLRFGPRDFIVIPRGTIYAMEFDPLADDDRPANATREEMPFGKFICFEAVNGSHILPPPRYISKKTAQFLEDAPYCERDLRVPQEPLCHCPDPEERGSFEMRIKALNRMHRYDFDYHPLDVVGWDGCYYPYCFNADEFQPIVGMVHLPPPIHQVFEAHNFVICAFCPRPLDFHPKAIPIPYNHSNIDSDEVMYYVQGEYKARRGIGVGSISLHPLGIPHGPHPGTIDRKDPHRRAGRDVRHLPSAHADEGGDPDRRSRLSGELEGRAFQAHARAPRGVAQRARPRRRNASGVTGASGAW
jgi:homogentisate 1,2-dioxygenase